MAKKTTPNKSAPKTAPKKKAPKKKAPPRPAPKAATKDAKQSPAPAQTPGKGKKRASRKTAAKVEEKPTKASCTPDTKGKKPCAKGKCGSGTCAAPRQLDGRSLFDRARECKDLEECRKFIVEFNEAVDQANQWLDDMHGQALSAEHARDIYGEQISELLEAIDIDRARIAELEAELKKTRGTKSPATDAALDKLAELGREVQAIRRDLRRLLDGRPLSTERRQRQRAEGQSPARRRGRPPKAQAAASPSGGEGSVVAPAPMRAPKTARRTNVAPGAFPKYSVLRGAACSLGVGKYGYPPEVCAPASFSREEAAQILGTYAQNKYGGLAKWALITGLPIDDVVVPLTPPKAAARKAAGSSTSRRAAGPGKPRRGRPSKGEERSNRQVLDQVLLTVARV